MSDKDVLGEWGLVGIAPADTNAFEIERRFNIDGVENSDGSIPTISIMPFGHPNLPSVGYYHSPRPGDLFYKVKNWGHASVGQGVSQFFIFSEEFKEGKPKVGMLSTQIYELGGFFRDAGQKPKVNPKLFGADETKGPDVPIEPWMSGETKPWDLDIEVNPWERSFESISADDGKIGSSFVRSSSFNFNLKKQSANFLIARVTFNLSSTDANAKTQPISETSLYAAPPVLTKEMQDAHRKTVLYLLLRRQQ